jgi:GntR family transcriptional regulator, hexuronate regulon transcriptional repressor
MAVALKHSRLYQSVAEKIARSIASGEYSPGHRLPAERELAQLYDVSRPTIREAIVALEIDGLVEVRIGAGVFVISATPNAAAAKMDIGAFELTEARLLFEGEVAALAAAHVTDAEIAELKQLLAEMDRANEKGDGSGELVDRKFHVMIGDITRNSAMRQVVEQFWTIRNRSPQCVRIFEKSRAKGYKPVVNEHLAIVEALENRDPIAARAAMRGHLNQVLQYLLDATELEAIEEAKAKMAEQRSRFGRTANA